MAERATILALLLDLVRVSPGDEQRETRWRRTRAELAQGDLQRERLIADLTDTRLLRTDCETNETVEREPRYLSSLYLSTPVPAENQEA